MTDDTVGRRRDDARYMTAEHLKERIYLSFTALAVLLAMQSHGHLEAGETLRTFLITIAGMLCAIFVADMMAHLLEHRRLFTRAELRHAVSVSFGSAGAVALPVLFLALAALGLWPVERAVRAAAIALIAGLVVIGWLAVRRADLAPGQKALVLLAEAGLAVGVVALEILAHG